MVDENQELPGDKPLIKRGRRKRDLAPPPLPLLDAASTPAPETAAPPEQTAPAAAIPSPRRGEGRRAAGARGEGVPNALPSGAPSSGAKAPPSPHGGEGNAAAPTAAPAAEPKPKRKRRKKAETADVPPPTEAATPQSDTPQTAPVAAETAPAPTAETEPKAPAEGGESAGAEGNGKEPEAEGAPPPVNEEELQRTVEALLFAAEEPIAPREIARASGSDSATIRKMLKAIKEAYDQQRRPWDLAEVAGGYRLVTRAEFFPAIQRLRTQTAQRKLTQAALETLALIAYRQPIGRAEIESVRGVGTGPVLRQLLDKKLIKIAGRGTGLGQPLLYGTTDYFLEHFGLRTIQELPKPGEFKNT